MFMRIRSTGFTVQAANTPTPLLLEMGTALVGHSMVIWPILHLSHRYYVTAIIQQHAATVLFVMGRFSFLMTASTNLKA